MKTLFENNDFILKSTGHDYDFVGIIETKTEEPLTFFFSEQLCEGCDEGIYWKDDIDESKTELLDVYEGLKAYDYDSDSDEDEEQETADSYMMGSNCDHVSYFRTRDDRSTGFLSNPKGRGQFLAIIKAYCPEQLAQIAWA